MYGIVTISRYPLLNYIDLLSNFPVGRQGVHPVSGYLTTASLDRTSSSVTGFMMIPSNPWDVSRVVC